MNKVLKIMIQTMIQYPICIVVLFIIYLIRPIVLIRIGSLSTWRMGHLAHDLVIYLADRIFLLKNGIIEEVFKVPFNRPRGNEIRTQEQFRSLKAVLFKKLSITKEYK